MKACPPPPSRARAVTLVDALLAMTILAIVMLGVTYATTAGHQHLSHGETALRGVRLAEHLVEEILSRPYEDLDAYDGIIQGPEGEDDLVDFTGELYPSADQAFTRTAAVTDQVKTVPDLDDFEVAGKRIIVTVEHPPTGGQWTLSRFVPKMVTQ